MSYGRQPYWHGACRQNWLWSCGRDCGYPESIDDSQSKLLEAVHSDSATAWLGSQPHGSVPDPVQGGNQRVDLAGGEQRLWAERGNVGEG